MAGPRVGTGDWTVADDDGVVAREGPDRAQRGREGPAREAVRGAKRRSAKRTHGRIVIPREKAHEMANRAVDVKEQEDRLRAEIERGSSLSKVLKLKKWEKVVG